MELNADLGELLDQGASDALLMPLIQRANIACGGHAGDPVHMQIALAQAARHGVLIGAHPSYPDREGFGRREVSMPREAVLESVVTQIQTLKSLADAMPCRLDHIKPHGALYNHAARDLALAEALVSHLKLYFPEQALLGLAGSAMAKAAARQQYRFIAEAFLDRAYEDDGSLRARTLPGAVLTLPEALMQARRLQQGEVISYSGQRLQVQAQSFCVHGDGAEALPLLRALQEAGFST